MKKLPAILIFILIWSVSFTQPAELLIRKGPKGYFLEHSVAAKEGLFPIGRLYNVHPRHIANFNGIDFNKGLSIGQHINIPLSDTNFKQNVNKGVPVYYRAAEKESLANISVKNNSVPLASLRSWNNITADNVPGGTKLIIGFLVTNEMQDRAVMILEKSNDVTTPPAEEKKMEVVAVNKTEPEIKKEEPPVVKKEQRKAESEILKEEPSVVKEETNKEVPVIMKQPEDVNLQGAGYFKNHFQQQLKSSPSTHEQTVTSSIFKTSHGWQDSKYYLLINDVEPGTIVKLTNPTNNKVIFAKVLYAMNKVRENQGVDIRISDAAAASLAIAETDKFILKVNY
jgi:hypothetical protein